MDIGTGRVENETNAPLSSRTRMEATAVKVNNPTLLGSEHIANEDLNEVANLFRGSDVVIDSDELPKQTRWFITLFDESYNATLL